MGNIGSVWCLSARSFRRCLILWRRTGCLTRRPRRSDHQGFSCQPAGEEWPPRLCLEGWKGITLEGGPVHCQSISVQHLWTQPSAHILGELGGQARSKQIDFELLQKWRDCLRIHFPFPSVIEHPFFRVCYCDQLLIGDTLSSRFPMLVL